MQKLEWFFSLVDKMSGPARKMAGALGKLGAAASKVGDGLKAGVSSLASKATAITATLGAAAAGLAVAGAKMGLDAMTFKQSTVGALSALTGSAQMGQDTYNHVLEMAKHFRKSPKDMLDSTGALITAGFQVNEAMALLQTGLDLKTLRPDADLKSLVAILGQIKSKGKLQTEELLQLAESGGLAAGKLFEALGGLKNIDVKTPAGMEKLQKMLTGGQIDADTGVMAVMKAVQGLTGTSKAGEFADKARNSVGALIEGLKSAPEQFLLRMNVEDGPLKKLLLMLTESLDPTTERGKRLMKSLEKVAETVMKLFGEAAKPEKIERFLVTLESMAKSLPTVISALGTLTGWFFTIVVAIATVKDNLKFLWAEFRSSPTWVQVLVGALLLLLSPLGLIALGVAMLAVGLFILLLPMLLIAAALYGIGVGVKWVIDKFGELYTWLSSKVEGFKGLGSAIVDGLLSGIKGAWGSLKTGWNELVGSLPAVVATKLQIQSPSRVMEKLGGYTVEGFAVGVEGGAPDARSALAGAVATPDLGGLGGAVAGGGRSTSVGNITINVDGSAAGGDPKATAFAIRAELQSLLESFALEGA
jgi:hypothetical protein